MIDWNDTKIDLIFEHFNKIELLDDFKKYNFVNLGEYNLQLEEYKVDDITWLYFIHHFVNKYINSKFKDNQQRFNLFLSTKNYHELMIENSKSPLDFIRIDIYINEFCKDNENE